MKSDAPISDKEIVRRARQSMREHALPDDVQRRLRRARVEAVEAADSARVSSLAGTARWLIPAGAAGAVAAVMVLNSSSVPPMPEFDEQELAAVVEMELLDDMEFVAWMLESGIEAETDGS